VTMDSPSERWWLVPRLNAAALIRLFCFPHAGGTASLCRTWHATLPSEIEVCGAQLPGRANRISEPAFSRLTDLVEAIGAAMTPLLDKPVAFFGHSMGAVVSFELARWLRRHHGLQPVHLFVSGRRAPQLPQTNAPTYLTRDDQFLATLGELNGTPQDFFREQALLELILPTLRADFEAVETYRYLDEPPLDCPIMVFGGRDDEESIDGRLDAWQSQTNRSCSKYMMDGGHFFIHSNEQRMLSLIRTGLLRNLAAVRERCNSQS
jgi:medium-chain acyl-[acyl-carrier-protein] hydrolase